MSRNAQFYQVTIGKVKIKYLSDEGEALNDTEKVLNSLGIALRDSATDWREPMQVLDDVGKRWKSLTDVDKSAIATALGGTYQRNTLMAILENWEQVSQAQEVAANSAGTSAQKYDIYLNSIQAHLNTLKTTWSEFLINMTDSGALNVLIDAFSKFVSILDVVINKTPMGTIVITALVAAIGRLTVAKAVDGVTKLATELGKLGKLNGNFLQQMVQALGNLVGISSSAGAGLSTVAAGEAAVGAASAGASGGIAALGASLMAIIPYVAVIAAIGTAIWAIGGKIKSVVNENKDLQASIEEHQTAYQSLQNDIDSYNEALSENKDRIQEIRDLEAVGKATSYDKEELANLERKNELLSQQIELVKRKQEIEKQEGNKDTEQLFANRWNTDKQSDGDKFVDFWTDSSDKHGVDKAAEKVEQYNQKVARYNQTLKNQQNILAKTNSTEEERALAQTNVDEALQNVQDSELELMDLREEVLDQYDSLSPSSKKVADGILKQFNNMKMVDSEFETYGDYLAYTSAEGENAASQIELVAAQFEKLAGTEVKPKDADSMTDWLNTLGETDLAKVEEVLLNCGNMASDLSTILGSMSGEDAARVLVGIYNDYYGIVQDCTAALNEFNTALNTDYDQQLAGYGEMLDYALQSKTNGMKNVKAYKAALEGLGLSADASLEDIKKLQTSLSSYVKFDSDGNMQKNIGAFRDKMEELIGKNKELGEYNEKTGEMTINSYKAMADAMGIPEQAFMALISSAEALYDITQKTQHTALQETLLDISEKAKEAQTNLQSLVLSQQNAGTLKWSGRNITFEDTDAGNAAKAKLVEQINKQIDELQKSAEGKGLDLRLPVKITTDSSDNDLTYAYQQINRVTQDVQTYIDSQGNFDWSVFWSKVKQGVSNGDLEGVEVDVDSNSINFKDTGASNKFTEWLQNQFKGIDSSSLIKNAIDLGAVTFTSSDNSGAEAFAGEVKQKIEAASSSQEIAWQGAIAGNLNSDQLKAIGDSAEGIKKVNDALDTLNKKNLSNVSGQIQNVGNQAAIAKDKVSNLATSIRNLPDKKKVVIEVSQTGTIPNLSGVTAGSAVHSANGRDMPAYANGKQQMGVPIRTQANANSLVGEEGKERVITADGRQYDVGKNGAEFVRLRKGDTVLPANITKMLEEGKLEQHDGNSGLVSSGRTGSTGNWYGGSSGWTEVSSYTSKYTPQSSNKSSKSTKTSSSSSGSSSKSSSGSSSKSSSSSSSSSSTSGTNEQAENELKALEHQRKMEYITEKQYAEKYRKIWETYYKDKAEYRDKDYEMAEKLHDLEKTFFEDNISKMEEEIDMLERTSGTEQQQIAIYKQMQQLYHQRAEQYRKQGFSDDSPEIRELSKEWWTLQDQIEEAQQNIFDNFINDWEHASDIIDGKIDLIPEVITQASETSAESMESLQSRLTARFDQFATLYKQKIASINVQMAETQTRLNELYKQGYEKNKEQIQKLEEQLLTYKKNILETANALKEQDIERYQNQIDYEDQLKEAIKDYAQSRADAIQDEIDKLEEENDALDKQAEKQKLLDALNSAKNRNKRVYHADTGWVWEADKDKIDEAQKAYDDFIKQEKIDELEKEKKQWDDYIDKVEKSSEQFQKEVNKQVAAMQLGADWQEKINKDMIDNLDHTVDNAVGILDSLIKKYDELYSAKLKISNMTPEEYAKNNGLEDNLQDTLTGMYTDPTTGVKYNKNTDYQALINDIDKEIARQEKEMGTHDSSLDTAKANYTAARTAKIKNEGATATGGYTITSEKGKDFLTDAKNGSTMTGGDGSTWVKDNNGNVTITTKDGKTHTIQGTSVTKTSSSSSSSGSSSKSNSSSSTSSSSTKTSTISGTLSSAISSVISAAKNASSSTTKKSYATGGVNDSLGIAALHGEKQRAEVIFNAEDAKKLWNYVHNMDSGLGDTVGTAAKALFDRITTTNTDNSTDIHIEHLELPSVKDSNSFVKQLKLVSLNR